MRLLAAGEPSAVGLERPGGRAPFVVTCDHAGNAIPRALGDLGLSPAERERHIAWDIGALGVAREISRRLDAPLVWQNYSRLVVDCNRPVHSPELMPERSEATAIPGNNALDSAARAARIAEIYAPYHATIAELLDQREAAGQDSVFVSVHSFTPVYHDVPRAWQLGVLYGSDTRLSDRILDCLREDADLCVGDNQPYRIDGKDHGLPEHAFRRELVNVLFEIRQDLIAAEHAQRAWGERLAVLLTRALDRLAIDTDHG